MATKKQLAKLEARIKELEGELETEQTAKNELVKTQRKNDRKLKELQFAHDEELKNTERLQDQVNKLNVKLKTMRRQVEEAVRFFDKIRSLNCEFSPIYLVSVVLAFLWLISLIFISLRISGRGEGEGFDQVTQVSTRAGGS